VKRSQGRPRTFRKSILLRAKSVYGARADSGRLAKGPAFNDTQQKPTGSVVRIKRACQQISTKPAAAVTQGSGDHAVRQG